MVKLGKYKALKIGLYSFWILHFFSTLSIDYFLSKAWIWNFISYFTPIFIISELLLLGIFFFFLREKIFAFITVVLIILSYPAITDTFQIHQEIKSQTSALKVLSYNVALIPYEIKNKEDRHLDTNASNEFFQLINKESPDILCLQEFHHEDIENMDVLNHLNEAFGYEYYVMTPVFMKDFKGYSGPIILSKYPIINDYHIKFKEGNNDLNHMIAVDIVHEQDTIRVINVHLKSMTIRLSKNDNYSRLKNGFYTQRSQVEEAYEYVKNSPFKVVFCGDFNSLPYSYMYQYLKRGLKNSFDKRGNGFGYTLNRFPYFVRIDNVFTSSEITVKSHKVLREYKQSDHFPVLVELGL